ncbi:ATP-binding protein [Streptomyces sp. SA15]|uniref:ATP-binding protein n=1 Tax=Streptomyces sp. SA15 TaxID=934019 RepID=UPI000BAF57E6|nr:ATP-binding protein [Streptomyces sp. SA15]PAZ10057.1 ATP-binding protein [Streptomyces sp. SA15]
MTGGLPPRPRTVDPSEQPSLRPVRPSDAAGSAVLRIRCSGEGFAEARSFTRDTLHCWSLDHRSDDAALVITELAANAVAHALPRLPASETEVWLGLLLDPAHVMLTVSDSGDNPPEYPATDGSGLREHGRGLCIVDALAEEWGWTLKPPAGKTVWAKLSTFPPP